MGAFVFGFVIGVCSVTVLLYFLDAVYTSNDDDDRGY